MENKDRKELDAEYYINMYIDEFTKYFPNIYTKEELSNILHNTVKHIYTFNSDIASGEYYHLSKEIYIKDINNYRTLFHEFTHALRSYYAIFDNLKDEDNKDNFYMKTRYAEEGMTDYVACIYKLRKDYSNDNINYFSFKKNKNLSPYNYASSYYCQLQHLYNEINKNNNFMINYLKGDNVYKYIYDVIYFYVNKLCEIKNININKDENSILSFRLSNMVLTYLADCGEFARGIKINNDELIEEYSILEMLNEQITNVLYESNIIDDKTYNSIGNSFLTRKVHVPNEEENKVLSKLFKEVPKPNIVIKDYNEIDDIACEFIVHSDDISDREVKR